MKKIAIDLTWVRHNKVGGTESCLRNLLDGFASIDCGDIKFILLLSQDNAASFENYKKCTCFEHYICNISSANVLKRILWQNLQMGELLRRLGVCICLEPIYGKPFWGTKGIKFITTIHDLQAKHYPQYFSKARVAWMKLSWKNAVRTSCKVIAISNFVKQDILKTYPCAKGKVEVIYDAIKIDQSCCAPETDVIQYGIKPYEYYYTVSSLFPHKNLKTAILAMAELKKQNPAVCCPLVISGIGGGQRVVLDQLIAQHQLQKYIIFTPFVDNAHRNMLYKYAKTFIFSSIFEGFGMPPLEAASFGVPVLTTRCTSLEEVTGGLLNYVEDPLDPIEWANKLNSKLSVPSQERMNALLDTYSCANIAKQYISLLTHYGGFVNA